MDESERQTLLGKLFEGGFIDMHPEGIKVRANEIMLHHELMHCFTRDAIEAYFKFQAGYGGNRLKFLAQMPFSSSLASLISHELGEDIASYYEKDGLINCERSTDYIFLSQCMVHGDSMMRAASELREMGSKIVFAICMYSIPKEKNIFTSKIDVYSTISREDIRRYYKLKSIGAV